MQSLTSIPSATASRTPVRRALLAVLVALALGLWLTVVAGPAARADAEPLAGQSWVS